MTTPHTTASGAADLPEFPCHPEPQIMMWNALEIVAIRKYGADMFRAGRLAASAPVAPTQEAEAVRWEFRWLNPGNNPYSSPSEMAWKLVEPKGMQPLEAALSDLRAYRYAGKPCYEVRPLFAQAAPVAPTQPATPKGFVLVPVEATEDMKAAAVKYANGTAVYKNVAAAALRIEEGIYGEVYEAMIAAAPKAAPITDAEQAAWHAGIDEGRSQVCAPLQQDEYLPLPTPDSYLFQHDETGVTQFVDAQQVEWGFEANNTRLHRIGGVFTESQMHAYVDADRAARGAAQAAPSPAAKQLGDAVVKWLGCETTKPRGDTGEPERRIDVSVERLGFAVAAVLKTVTAPAPASGEAVSPFGYFRAEPFGWADCAESDEGARPLYEAPPAQEVQREEVCKCCGEGMARLVVTRECDTCTSVYAGMSEYAIAKNARAPLSAPQIAAMYLGAMVQQHMFSMVEGAVTRFTRAVEKHHGITAAQKETP